MKKYDIYGMGNALVDMEFQVDAGFLERMKVEKGVMTLVDQKRQDLLLESLCGQRPQMSCGGSAANTMIALAQLGGQGFYSCKVAFDETGEFFYRDLMAQGIKSNLNKNRPSGVTGKCMVFITPDADRTMNTCLGITETFSEEELVEKELGKARYLYIEGYLLASQSGRKAALKASQMAKREGVKTALTFSDPNIVKFFKKGLLEIIGPKVDVLFCNKEEALSFTETSSVEKAAKKLQDLAEILVITLGPLGALLSKGHKPILIPGIKVPAVDTNGAGDLFAGSFLYGVSHDYGFETSARLACTASARLVTQYGPRLKPGQMLSIKREILDAK